MSFEIGPRRTKWWKPDWVIDTSRLVHQTGTLQLLHDVTTKDLNEIAEAHRDLGGPNDHPLIVGSGTVKYDEKINPDSEETEEKIRVPKVCYIPAEKENIISVAQLSRDQKLETVFDRKYCYIRKQQDQVPVNVGWGRFCNGRYVLEYLIINENDEIKAATPDITSDVDDEASQAQASSDDPQNLFGLARFGSSPPLMVSNLCCNHVCTGGSMTAPDQQQRTHYLFMDSGAVFHSTWNPDIIELYTPRVSPPTESINGFSGTGQGVEGYGYISSDIIKVEGVLYIPGSYHHLVSVGQLTYMYNVRIGFNVDWFWIEEFTGQRVGHGQRLGNGNHYVLEEFLPSKPLHADEMLAPDFPPPAAPYLAHAQS